MPTLERLFAFNRFPIDKGIFLDLVNLMCERKEFARIFLAQTRRLDKVYVTMSDKELASLAKRLDSPRIIENFASGDGLYSEDKKVVILHVPAMVRTVSSTEFVISEEQRRALFALNFFACLFHELSHANEARRIVVDSWLARNPESKAAIKQAIDRFEETAEKEEGRYIELMSHFLEEHNASWIWLAEALFNWEKLQRHVTL